MANDDLQKLSDEERALVLELRAKNQKTVAAEKPAANLREYFQRAGIPEDRPITAAQVAGALEYLAPTIFPAPDGHAPSPHLPEPSPANA